MPAHTEWKPGWQARRWAALPPLPLCRWQAAAATAAGRGTYHVEKADKHRHQHHLHGRRGRGGAAWAAAGGGVPRHGLLSSLDAGGGACCPPSIGPHATHHEDHHGDHEQHVALLGQVELAEHRYQREARHGRARDCKSFEDHLRRQWGWGVGAKRGHGDSRGMEGRAARVYVGSPGAMRPCWVPPALPALLCCLHTLQQYSNTLPHSPRSASTSR